MIGEEGGAGRSPEGPVRLGRRLEGGEAFGKGSVELRAGRSRKSAGGGSQPRTERRRRAGRLREQPASPGAAAGEGALDRDRDAERPSDGDGRVLRVASYRVPVRVGPRPADEDPVDVVEAAAHYPFARVAQVEGVPQLVEHGAQRGGEAPAVGPPIVAVVHELLRVDERRVQEPRDDLRETGGPGVEAGGAEEREAAPAEGRVSLRPGERVLVRPGAGGAPVARARKEGQVLAVLRGQRTGHELASDELPEVPLGHRAGSVHVQHAVHHEALGPVEVPLELEGLPAVAGLAELLRGERLQETRAQADPRRGALDGAVLAARPLEAAVVPGADHVHRGDSHPGCPGLVPQSQPQLEPAALELQAVFTPRQFDDGSELPADYGPLGLCVSRTAGRDAAASGRNSAPDQGQAVAQGLAVRQIAHSYTLRVPIPGAVPIDVPQSRIGEHLQEIRDQAFTGTRVDPPGTFHPRSSHPWL